MRLILSLLAVANLRWAVADLHRSQLLSRQADEAYALAGRRMALAQGLADRAHAHR